MTVATAARRPARCWLAALLASTCGWLDAATLTVDQPDPSVPTAGGELVLVYTLTSNGSPVVGAEILTSANFGTPAAADLTTDAIGQATLKLSSAVEGAGTVTAYTLDGDGVAHSYSFVAPTKPQVFIETALPALEPSQSMDVRVRAIDSALNPLAGATVVFTGIDAAVGSVAHSSLTLGADGRASTTFTVDPGASAGSSTPIRVELAVLTDIRATTSVDVAPANAYVLEFLQPPAGTRVATGASQQARVRYATVGGRPVANWPIDITTTLGTVSDQAPETNVSGIATFTTESNVEGGATLTAATGALSDTLDIEFVEPSQILTRYDARSNGATTQLWVDFAYHDNSIALLTAPGVQASRVQQMASEAGLTVGPAIDERFVVLMAPNARNKTDLQTLAQRVRFRHPEEVRAAGLLAKVAPSEQPYLISSQIVARPAPAVGGIIAFSAFLKSLNLDIAKIEPDPSGIELYTLTLDPNSSQDPLQVAADLADLNELLSAEPLRAWVIDWRANPWDDVRYPRQWHLENKGDWALEDADADVREAWEFTWGGSQTMIAVLDSGFDISHQDLLPNLWVGPNGERGRDLVDGDHSSLLNGAMSPIHLAHGTRSAGVAAARGGNTIGVTGACPLCKLLPIRFEPTIPGIASAIYLTETLGASVVSNSWGIQNANGTITGALADVRNKGVVVLFAMSNEDIDNCVPPVDISADPNVIGVSGITDEDKRSTQFMQAQGHGPCMDILSPTGGGVRRISTTSVVDTTFGVYSTWTDSFDGTSAATPLSAGVVGLIQHTVRDSLNIPIPANYNVPRLRPWQVQAVLQDTADRAEPTLAEYDRESGFSKPAAMPTHGYGRINAYEAVMLSAPTAVGGRDNKDLMLRDNELDWGNTGLPSSTRFSSPRGELPVNRSVDVKIDVEPYQGANPVNTPQGFVDLVAESPQPNRPGRVYLRIRNRGHATVSTVDARLDYAVYQGSLPALPVDFWKMFPAPYAANPDWIPLPSQTESSLPYSGATAAGCPARVVPPCPKEGGVVISDAAVILSFDLPAIAYGPGDDLALLAVLDANPEDRARSITSTNPSGPDELSVMFNVLNDNNVALWTTEAPVIINPPDTCPDWLKTLFIVLALLALGLLIWILYYLVQGMSPPAWLVVIFILVLILLAWLYHLYESNPGCSGSILGIF